MLGYREKAGVGDLPKGTWIIRDQQPDGSWGPEREVTLDQYRAEINAASRRAREVFEAAAAAVRP